MFSFDLVGPKDVPVEMEENPSLASCRISLQNHRFFYICYIF